jgi:hypothetical protein
MLPVFLDYSLLITLCVLSNVYLLQSVQCVVANITFVPRLLIVDYPQYFVYVRQNTEGNQQCII